MLLAACFSVPCPQLLKTIPLEAAARPRSAVSLARGYKLQVSISIFGCSGTPESSAHSVPSHSQLAPVQARSTAFGFFLVAGPARPPR